METMRKLFDGIRFRLHLSVPAAILFFAAAGLILLIRPDTALTLICRLIGIVLLVYGIRNVVRYVRRRDGSHTDGGLLSVLAGVVLIVIGLLVARNPVSLVNLAAVILSLILIGVGAFWFFVQRNKREGQTVSQRISKGAAIFLIVMGILLLFSPFQTTAFLLRLIGIAFLFAAGAGLLYYRKTDPSGHTAADTAAETAHWFTDLFGRATGKDINGKDIIDGTAEDVTDEDT